MTLEDDALAFAAAAIGSVWALEVLLFLKRGGHQCWRSAELIRELRSSETAIADALAKLRAAGLVDVPADGRWQYRPVSGQLGQVVAVLETLYQAKPASVIRALVAAPDSKLRLLSDAFRIKDKE